MLNVAHEILSYYMESNPEQWRFYGTSKLDLIKVVPLLIKYSVLQKRWNIIKASIYIDYKNANDSMHRQSLDNIMKDFEMSQKLINFIKMYI